MSIHLAPCSDEQADRQTDRYSQTFLPKQDTTVDKAREGESAARLERTLRSNHGNPVVSQGKGGSTFQSSSELVGGDGSTHACPECWREVVTVRNDTEYEREHLSPYPLSAISCRQLFVVRAFILVARG